MKEKRKGGEVPQVDIKVISEYPAHMNIISGIMFSRSAVAFSLCCGIGLLNLANKSFKTPPGGTLIVKAFQLKWVSQL